MRAHYQRWIDAGRDTFGYNRFVERLDLRVYKRFDSDNPSGLACIECGHENPDGEALSWAAGRLLAAARRRILMVLSDGYPATGDGNPAILRTDLPASTLRERRVELIGVGILDDAVETFIRSAAWSSICTSCRARRSRIERYTAGSAPASRATGSKHTSIRRRVTSNG